MSKIALAFLVVFVTSLGFSLVKSAAFGFYLYELIYFLNPASRWWSSGIPDIKYSFIASAFLIAGFLIHRSKCRSNTFSKIPGKYWFLLLLFCYFISGFFSVIPEMHDRFVVETYKAFVIIYIGYRVLDSERKLEWALLVFAIGAAYVSYEAYSIGRNAYGRVDPIGPIDAPDSNGLATTLAPALPLLIFFGWQTKWKHKLLIGVIGALVVNALVLINSRGGFLAGAIGCVYFLSVMIFAKIKMPRQRLMTGCIIVVMLIGAVRVVDNQFLDRMATIETQSSRDSEGSGGKRINFWLATFDVLKDYPMGVGIYGYQVLSPIYLQDDSYFEQNRTYQGQMVRAVHSFWFQAMSELGYHGFIVTIALLISIMLAMRRAQKQCLAMNEVRNYYLGAAILASCITFLVAGSFINAFRMQLFYWLLCFCAAYSAVIQTKFETFNSSNKVKGE